MTQIARQLVNEDEVTLQEFKKIYRISTKEEFQDMIDDFSDDTVAPALCRHECETEHDGVCSHGCPSVFLALGLV